MTEKEDRLVFVVLLRQPLIIITIILVGFGGFSNTSINTTTKGE